MDENLSGQNNPSDDMEIKPEPKPTMSPLQAAVFGLVAVFLIYQVGGSLLTLLIFGFDFQNADINALRLLTAAGQVLLILAPALIFTKLVYQDVTYIIRLKLPSLKEIGLFVLGLAILIPLLQSYLYIQNYFLNLLAENSSIFFSIKEILDSVNEFVEQTYKDLLNAGNAFEAALIVIIVSVVPAICEEVFFRGYILKSFEYRFKPYIAALITAVFFGLYHFNPYGLLALIALGFYLGFATYKSNSIVVPMVIHFLNNFVAIMAFFIFGSEDFMDTDNITNEGLYSQITGFIVLGILFAILMVIIKKYYNNSLTNERRIQDDLPEV